MSTQQNLSTTDQLTGKLTLAAFNPRTQLPVTCRPCLDKTGRLYTGQGEFGYFENLTEDEKRNLPLVIDYDTSVVLEDGKIIDLDNPIDAANWKWLQKHPYLTLDKEKKTKETAFYVVNPNKEAKMYVDKTAKIDEARPAVRRLAFSDQVKVASSLGLSGAETFAPDQLLSWLLHKCNESPQAVLEAIDPSNKSKVNATIFLREIIKWGVIERLRDGVFYFGGESGVAVGHSDDMVISYLLNPENKERVKAMKNMLVEKTKVGTKEEIGEAEHVI